MRKGLHGVLIPIDGDMGPAEDFLTKLRHIHPWELALLMGLRPNKNWGTSLKLAIAGIGIGQLHPHCSQDGYLLNICLPLEI